MKTHTLTKCFSVVVLSTGLVGCVTLSGSAKMSADGSTAVLAGGAPLEVRAEQPPLPPPKKAKVVEERIEITEKVQFAYNDATILAASNDLLNDVAAVMNQHPEIKKIRIEGHASSEGEADYNKKLSDRRAKSVMAFLVDAGVDPERMEAIGYGEERPIADNETEEGRERNRRVEFNIIARFSKEELERLKAAAAEGAAGGGFDDASSDEDEETAADDAASGME